MQTYSSRATARRAAMRQKLTPAQFTIQQDRGRWVITISPDATAVQSDPAPAEAEPIPADPAPDANSRPVASRSTVRKPKRSSKTKQRDHESTVVHPVAFIWHWLAQDGHAKLKRADAIAALSELGIAPGTASTQRFRFLSASPAERAARAARYEEANSQGPR